MKHTNFSYYKLQKFVGKIGFFLLLALIVVCAVFPFVWAIITSLKSGSDLFSSDIDFSKFTLSNYKSILFEQPFGRNILNSLFVSVSTVLIALSLAFTAAFAIGRIEFRGRKRLLLMILAVSMFPQIAILSGMFELIRSIGFYDQLYGLIFSYLVLVLPYTTWILTTFMRQIPKEIEEAAIMDGASSFQILTKIFMPLLGPALITTGLLSFVTAWNEFLFALTLTLSSNMRTVPVAIALISGSSEFELPWGNIMAASVLVTLPLVILMLVFQRKIISGITSGAVKG